MAAARRRSNKGFPEELTASARRIAATRTCPSSSLSRSPHPEVKVLVPPGEHRKPARHQAARRSAAAHALRGDPRDDHPDGGQDRRSPGKQPGSGRAHGRAAQAARFTDRQAGLGHRPPGLRPQAADRSARQLRDASPAGRDGRIPAAIREPARHVRRWPRRHRPLDCRGPCPDARPARHQREGRGGGGRRGADHRHGAGSAE